jgi:hypothetical protein
MNINDATIGTRVRTNTGFADMPIGTEGIIDEDYGTGIMVAWDLPGNPLPKHYVKYDGQYSFVTGIVRDGFDKKEELHQLEMVGQPKRQRIGFIRRLLGIA